MATSVSRAALVLFAHGARDPDWSAPFRAIQRRVAARCPDVTVAVAFLELTPPALDDVLEQLAAAGHERITVAPLFMAPGGHVKRDLPPLLEALRQRHPGLAIDLLPSLGEVEPVISALSDWLVARVQR